MQVKKGNNPEESRNGGQQDRPEDTHRKQVTRRLTAVRPHQWSHYMLKVGTCSEQEGSLRHCGQWLPSWTAQKQNISAITERSVGPGGAGAGLQWGGGGQDLSPGPKAREKTHLTRPVRRAPAGRAGCLSERQGTPREKGRFARTKKTPSGGHAASTDLTEQCRPQLQGTPSSGAPSPGKVIAGHKISLTNSQRREPPRLSSDHMEPR